MKPPFRLASSLLAVLVVASAVALADPRLHRSDTYRVSAYFDKTIGLFENSKVMVLGVPVGKVTNIGPRGQRVRVDMEISDDHKIPASARAHIVPISLIADRYVQFEPVYRGGPALQDGDVLERDQTRIPAELDDVFEQLDKLLDAIEPGEKGDPGALGELIVQLDAALEDREQDLRGTLIQTAKLTRTLAGARAQLSGVLINLDDLFTRLATRSRGITTLNRNLATVMTTLASSRRDLEGAVANLGRMSFELGDLIRDHRRRLGEDVTLASRIAASVLDNRASVVEALRWLPVAGAGFANAYHPGEVDALDVRDNTTAGVCNLSPSDVPPAVSQLLLQLQHESCPNPPAADEQSRQARTAEGGLVVTCKQNVRRIKRDLRRLSELGLPREVEQEMLAPLKRKARRLARKCRDVADAFEDSAPQDAGARPPPIGELPDIGGGVDAEGLTGSAAGAVVVPEDERTPASRTWLQRLLEFLRW